MSPPRTNDIDISAGTALGVVDGALFVFSPEISKEQKRDVSESTLLAQLAAGRQYDRIKDADDWYDSYVYHLQKIGWIISGGFDFAPFSGTVAASQFVTDSLKQDLDSVSMRDVHRAVDVVKGLSEGNDAVKIFTEGSSEGGDSNFQVGYCHTLGYDAVLGVGAFAYHAQQNVKNPLSSKLKGPSANAKYAYTTMTLNARAYDMVRQAVRTKLGGNTNKIVDVSM